jgi:transcriptional regulator with XRE-family HTH domain
MMPQVIPAGDILAKELQDPGFRAHWERTALARAFALWLVKYRVDHDLSQRALADLLDMHQSAVARLEAGDHAVRFETLQRIMARLNKSLLVHIAPNGIAIEDQASDDDSGTKIGRVDVSNTA